MYCVLTCLFLTRWSETSLTLTLRFTGERAGLRPSERPRRRTQSRPPGQKKRRKKEKCVTFESKQSTNYDTPSEVTFKTFRQTSSVEKGENAK